MKRRNKSGKIIVNNFDFGEIMKNVKLLKGKFSLISNVIVSLLFVSLCALTVGCGGGGKEPDGPGGAQGTTYTVTFDTDGGSEIEEQTVVDGELVTKPSNPTKNGYEFYAWDFDFSTPIENDTVISAIWKKLDTSSPYQLTRQSKSYSANFSQGLPSDWTLFSGSNTTSVTASNTSYGVKIVGTGAGRDKYFGGLYQIGGISAVGDFELNMNFKVTAYADDARFFGVLYHSTFGSTDTAFMMNYRVNGKSAQSTITPKSAENNNEPGFLDAMEKNTGVTLSNGAEHTLSIKVVGSRASHYIDGNLILSYSLYDYSSKMGRNLTAGNFGLIVNNLTLEIGSLEINGTSGTDVIPNTAYATNLYTHNYTYNMTSMPTVVQKITNEDAYNGLTDSVRPQNAIFTVNKAMQIIDDMGYEIEDYTLENAVQSINGKVIPCVYLKNMDVAESFVAYWRDKLLKSDMSVISQDTSVVKYVRDALPLVRGIVDWSNQTVNLSNATTVIAETNKAWANVAILNYTDANAETVRYIQSRLKTVWTDIGEYSTAKLMTATANETYGIVSNKGDVYNDFNYFADSDSIINVNRQSFNIAHRGLCQSEPENSLTAYKKAYETGSTHLEVDVRLTSDKQIVVMHDDTIDRTTNGSGKVAEMTLAQIQQYKIDVHYSGSAVTTPETVPSLAEVFDYFKDKDVGFALEIKSKEYELVSVLKQLMTQYNMFDKLFIITFNTETLSYCNELLPTVPTAYLNYGSCDKLVDLAKYNAGTDTSSRDGTVGLMMRGYMSYYWTYQTAPNVVDAIKNGVIGITNNEANEVKTLGEKIYADGDVTVNSIDELTTVKLTLEYFSGTTKTVDGTLIYGDYIDGEYYAVFSYSETYTVKGATVNYSLFTTVKVVEA